jgi:hypothetical protein
MAASTAPAHAKPAHAKPDRQNITLSLSAAILKKARVLAAERGTSVTGLLTRQIEELVEKDDSYQRAKAGALAMLRSGFTFGKIDHMTREEMHDRKSAREALAEADDVSS